MQERFQNILKQRFLLEYEDRPPLFPWESEVAEYPADSSSFEAAAVPTLWDVHTSKLPVSGLLPAPLLKALFERCQVMARTPVKQGIRLVRAVEDMFPDQADILEPIADMVLVPAYRSADAATRDALTQELTAVASDYDAALPEQQIALSMLAAQEIMGALTLSLSAEQLSDHRLWMTGKGVLDLRATYAKGSLMVSVTLPEGGQIELKGSDLEGGSFKSREFKGSDTGPQAERSLPGSLEVSLAEPSVSKTYILEVLLESEAVPLNFAIHLGADLSN